MKYTFHPDAYAEFQEATRYYCGKSPALASAFYTEIEYAIHSVIENPILYRAVGEDVRRCWG